MIYFITMILAVFFIYPLKEYNNDNSSTKLKYKYKKIYIGLSFIVALLPIAFRYGIGTDYFYTYYPYFQFIGKGERYFDEIGFNILNKIIYILTGDFRVLIVVTSFIFLYFIYKGIIKNSKDLVFSILMIFIGQSYFYSMNMIRQSIAISMIFFAISFLKEDKKIKYILICILASTIHISALLMIPLAFINDIHFENKTKIYILMLIMLTSPIINSILNFVIMGTKYAWYYSSIYTKDFVSTIVIILNIVVFALDLLYSSKNRENREYKLYSNINFFGLILLIVANSVPLFNRLIRYFSIFQILFIPMIIKSEKNRNMNLLLKIFIFNLFFITMYYQIFLLGGDEVVPYVSIFNC